MCHHVSKWMITYKTLAINYCRDIACHRANDFNRHPQNFIFLNLQFCFLEIRHSSIFIRCVGYFVCVIWVVFSVCASFEVCSLCFNCKRTWDICFYRHARNTTHIRWIEIHTTWRIHTNPTTRTSAGKLFAFTAAAPECVGAPPSKIRGAKTVSRSESTISEHHCRARGFLHCQQSSAAGHIYGLQVHLWRGYVFCSHGRKMKMRQDRRLFKQRLLKKIICIFIPSVPTAICCRAPLRISKSSMAGVPFFFLNNVLFEREVTSFMYGRLRRGARWDATMCIYTYLRMYVCSALLCMYRALLGCVGLFCGDIGLFCSNTGLHWCDQRRTKRSVHAYIILQMYGSLL